MKMGMLRSLWPLWSAGLCAAALTCACNRSAPAPVPEASPSPADLAQAAPPQPVALPPAATATGLPAEPTVTRGEVDELLDAWLAAQNQGIFKAYEGLYAHRMTGVRRTGPITKRLDRANWMEERRRMFVKAMQVRAEDLNVIGSPGMAQVRFVQHFATGDFADEGPKLMIVVREEGALRIAREEMLASRLVDGTAQGERPKSEGLALAWATETDTWLVVGTPEGVTAVGAPSLLSRDRPAAAVRAVALAQGSPWWQRDVVLYGKSGEVCRGQVDRAGVLARMVPHFGREQVWKGEEDGHRWSAREIAAEVWDQAGQAAMLAVHVRVYQGQCESAVWGRASNLPPPLILAQVGLKEGQLFETTMKMVRSLTTYQRIQRDYEARVPGPRSLFWDQYDGAKATVVSLAGGGQRMVLVRVRSGDFCGGFGGEQVFALQITSPPDRPDVLRLITDERAGDLQFPQVGADVDGDGDIELIAPQQVFKRGGATWRPVWTVEIPDLDCPC